MEVCNCTVFPKPSSSEWCDFWKPPPIPPESASYSWTAFQYLLSKSEYHIENNLLHYAENCPGHITLPPNIGKTTERGVTSPVLPTSLHPKPVQEVTSPVLPTSLHPKPVQEVSTASLTWVMILIFFLVLLIALVGAFFYWKKKHGRYFPHGRCFTLNGTSCAKFRGKYLRRFNSKDSATVMCDQTYTEMKVSMDGKENLNYSPKEHEEFLPKNQNGSTFDTQLSVHMSAQNNITQVQCAQPNDYVDYSNITTDPTKDSPKLKSVSISQESVSVQKDKVLPEKDNVPTEQIEESVDYSNITTDPTKGSPKLENVSISQESVNVQKDKVLPEKDSVPAEQIEESNEPVKIRKKSFKLGQSNKIHSWPPYFGKKDEIDKRKTF